MNQKQQSYQSQYFEKSSYQGRVYADEDAYDGSAARELYQPLPNQKIYEEPQIEAPRRALFGKAEKMLLAGFGLLILSLVFVNLFFQWQKHQMTVSLNEFQEAQSELTQESDIMLNEIAQNYDYEQIKEVAEANGMVQDRNRVKDIAQ